MSDTEVYKTLSSYSNISTKHLFTAVKSTNNIDLGLINFICDGLISAGEAIHKMKDCGISVLGYTCKNGKEDFVKYLLQKCNNKIRKLINSGDPSPLWLAASNGHKNIVEILLEKTDVIKFNKKASDGTRPLAIAIAKGHFHIVQMFVEKGVTSMYDTLQQCAKFGKHKYIADFIKTSAKKTRQEDLNYKKIVRNSVRSGCQETIASVQQLITLDIAQCFDKMPLFHSRHIREIMGQSTAFENSSLVKMSQCFPLFNVEVEKTLEAFNEGSDGNSNDSYNSNDKDNLKSLNSNDNDSSDSTGNSDDEDSLHGTLDDKGFMAHQDILLDENIKPLILGDFCFIKATNKSKYYLKSFGHVGSFKCPKSCKKKQNCQIIVDLLSAVQLLEDKLLHKSSSMSYLGPTFALIGSVAEGTRLQRASEMDITVEFQHLKETPFTVEDKATKIMAPDCMKKFHLSKTSTIFDYPRFMLYFLRAIEKALIKIRDKIPKNLKFFYSKKDSRDSFNFCHACEKLRRNESIYEPWTHCTKCLPAVTHTKLSPCLIFQWNDGSLDESLVVTVDLVAIFPISGKSTLELYNLVFKTLIEDQPPGWLDYFNNILKRDIILPEFLSSQSPSGTADVTLKLLNYGPTDNYIIRPAQEMEIQREFREIPKLKKVYLYMKALNVLFHVDAKSYFMKKVLLLPDFKAKAMEPTSRIDELVCDAISHPDLRKLFEKKILIDALQKSINESKSHSHWLETITNYRKPAKDYAMIINNYNKEK